MNICSKFKFGNRNYAHPGRNTVCSLKRWYERELEVCLMELKTHKSFDAFGGVQVSFENDDNVEITPLRIELITALINCTPKKINI